MQQELTTLRDRLNSYKENIEKEFDPSKIEQDCGQPDHQVQILKALETLIKKMDFQLSLQIENSIGRNDNLQGSNRRAKAKPKNYGFDDSTVKMSETRIVERPSMDVTVTQQQVDQTIQECSDTIEATNQSAYLSSRKSHMRNFNKSGYQVKHSKYGQYEFEEQVMNGALDTNEEQAMGSNTSWLNEIKHIKSLLGGMAEHQNHTHALGTTLALAESKPKKQINQES